MDDARNHVLNFEIFRQTGAQMTQAIVFMGLDVRYPEANWTARGRGVKGSAWGN